MDPEYLFTCAPYASTGAIFWPDYGQFKKTEIIWTNCGLDRPPGPEFESGQMVVDKKRCWRALCLAMWFNEQSDFYYQHLHGDKETFHIAFRKLEKSAAMPATPIHSLEGTMCQHDFEGRRIFQHRNTDKWNLFLANRKVEDFRYEAECRGFIAELQKVWDGRVGRFVGERPERKAPGPRRGGIRSKIKIRSASRIRITACMISCRERQKVRARALRSFEKSDWPEGGIRLHVDGSGGRTRQESLTKNAYRALRHALQGTKADYILFLEDDVEVNRFLHSNLLNWPPLIEGRITLAGLYNPGLKTLACDVKRQAIIVDPESIYGSQAFLMSRATVSHVLKHWDEVEGMQDIKISRLVAQLGKPIFYHVPSLVQHVGKTSTWGGGFHSAADYDPLWKASPIAPPAG
jgi:hypothetical protein